MADDVREVTSAYHAHGDTELTLAPGDYVTILEGDSPAHEGWAFGKVGDREGWFPASSAARATRAEADPSSGPEQPALRRLRSLPGRLRTRLKATSRYDSRGENEVSVGAATTSGPVGALKRLAADRRVDIGDCVEKGDIVRALQSSIAVLKADQALEAERDAALARCEALRRDNAKLRDKLGEYEEALGTPRARGLTCAICFDGPVQVAIFPCGHCFTCTDCAAKIRECSQCHGKIEKRLRVYIAGS
ncbi:DUF4792-containing protein [Aureococcus anophagefferens]|nr:DUF4792-containing protein [Aureococcus anophagefferens]